MKKNNELGIYLHIPFCESKCKYCDFVSFCNFDEYIEDYFNALKKEIAIYGDKYRDKVVDSIFFGGGTPSYVDGQYISEIMKALKENFIIAEDLEVTIESNPNSIDEEKLNTYIECGINRISIGVQSFNDQLLKRIGRVHNRNQAINAVKMAKSVGFKNISIDLISSIPGQTIEDIDTSIEIINDLEIDHISYYSLILEEGTPLYKEYSRGLLPDLPSEDCDRQMYSKLNSSLQEIGFSRYEISNFSKPNKESKHNLKYWKIYDYIGLGLSSHSSIGNNRFYNTSALNDYISKLNEYGLPIIETERIDIEERLSEFIIMGFRLINGINIDEINNRFNIDFLKEYKDEIDRNIANGLIKIADNNVSLTNKGADLANIVELDFYR